MDWFLYDRDLRHERVKLRTKERRNASKVIMIISVTTAYFKENARTVRES